MKEIRDKIAVHKDFFKFLSEKTGLVIEEPLLVYEVYNLLTAQVSQTFLDDYIALYKKCFTYHIEHTSIRPFVENLKFCSSLSFFLFLSVYPSVYLSFHNKIYLIV